MRSSSDCVNLCRLYTLAALRQGENRMFAIDSVRRKGQPEANAAETFFWLEVLRDPIKPLDSLKAYFSCVQCDSVKTLNTVSARSAGLPRHCALGSISKLSALRLASFFHIQFGPSHDTCRVMQIGHVACPFCTRLRLYTSYIRKTRLLEFISECSTEQVRKGACS